MSPKLSDRRLLAVLAVLGLALLALRRRRGDPDRPPESGEPADPDEFDPEDLPDPDDAALEDLPDMDDIDPEELSLDIEADIEADIGAVEAGEDPAVEALADEEFDIDPEDLALPDDGQLADLLAEVMDDEADLSTADIRETVREQFETAEVDEDLLAEVRSAVALDDPSDGEAPPDRETAGDADLDTLDYLAVLAAGLRGAHEEYHRRTDDGGA